MTPAQHVAFGRLFGELTVHPFVPHLEAHPEVIVLDNHKDNPVFSTDVWHSDETFRLTPPMGSILRCIRRRRPVATRCGRTWTPPMKVSATGCKTSYRGSRRCTTSGISATNSMTCRHAKSMRNSPRWRKSCPTRRIPSSARIPSPGRRRSIVNEQFTLAIKGMREDESASLLAFLYVSSRASRNTSSASAGRLNDMVFWDNRPTQHYAANDYYPERRTMQRVTIKGDKPQ